MAGFQEDPLPQKSSCRLLTDPSIDHHRLLNVLSTQIVDQPILTLLGLHLKRRAGFCRKFGKNADALPSFERALALSKQEPERRFLEKWLAELD